MAVFFLCVIVLVQVAFLITSRAIVGAAVDASARRIAVGDVDLEAEQARVAAEVRASAPGAEIQEVRVERTNAAASVVVVYRWHPPGPDLVPVDVQVERTRAAVIPP